ncbi:polyketide cyclase [Leptolyngbya sp. Heron Island J]|uniref:SRPBCC domain-containing protein n=1 Tax=Leptolyngbya sp. Heron Island J TaxID=1385935 RepID=UPI0003B95559|nr:SRPBCC domain-containing protein [Leptolyngbya sp. Heron Island J]ESA32946.1 polyketide cyclase [Leptolyngbya sp. Heron Island J]
MPSLYAEIEINATAAEVWDALVRKEDWRYWNTFLYDCDPRSNFMLGREVFLAMQRIEGDADTEFQPVVTTLRPGNCLRWVSKIPGLKTEHSFEMQEITPGRTRYLHRDIFMGPLANVFLPFIREDERDGLRRMAYQLKRYVESGGKPQRDPYGNPYSNPYDRSYQNPYGGQGYDNRGYGGQGGRGYPERSYDDRGYGRDYQGQGYERGYDDRGYGGQGGRGYPDQGQGYPEQGSGRNYPERGYDDRRYRDQGYDDRGYDERGRDRNYPERDYRDEQDYRDDGW